jgi:cell division protein FtsN
VSNRRLTARDYKGAQRSAFEFLRWREFAAGLAVGLVVALAVYIGDHRGRQAPEEVNPAPRKATPEAGAAAAGANAGDETDYSFYKRLPQFEVVVPEKERPARVSATARIDKPGTYYLQILSSRDQAEAERVRAQLARQDISASVQRVAIDADVWHRVRVGPIKDLTQLNRLRSQLEAADYRALVVRVEE